MQGWIADASIPTGVYEIGRSHDPLRKDERDATAGRFAASRLDSRRWIAGFPVLITRGLIERHCGLYFLR